MICLFELDTLDQTSEHLVDKVEKRLVNSFLDKVLDKAINKASKINKSPKKKSEQISRKTTSKKSSLVGESSTENGAKKKKQKNIKKDTIFGKVKIDDLLDLEFFENCFFGKKLTIKDQLIFKIYA